MLMLSFFLKKLIRHGRLTVIDADGRKHLFEGQTGTEKATIRFHSKSLPLRIFLNPEVIAGEAWMDGEMTLEDGTSIYDFLYLITRNMEWRRDNPLYNGGRSSLARLMGTLNQINPIDTSKKNVAHHYDLSGELYELFLDPDRQYSCAYFTTPDDTLEQAQRNKKETIARKLMLDKSHRVLDIGCGWGGLALTLNQLSGARVKGITLSEEQYAYARKRASNYDGVEFELKDYRLLRTKYDRIVSVGMFEHVGVLQYQTFFDKIHDCLEDDGVALLHTIGRASGPGATDKWTRKYIFPGGYAPALSEILPHIEKAGLYVTDVDVWRLHYAETLRHWRMRVDAARNRIVELYDERFLRMWQYYLASAECAFRNLAHVVFQIQIAKRQDAVPFTRDYQYRKET